MGGTHDSKLKVKVPAMRKMAAIFFLLMSMAPSGTSGQYQVPKNFVCPDGTTPGCKKSEYLPPSEPHHSDHKRRDLTVRSTGPGRFECVDWECFPCSMNDFCVSPGVSTACFTGQNYNPVSFYFYGGFPEYMSRYGILRQTFNDEPGQSKCKYCPPGAMLRTQQDTLVCECADGFYTYDRTTVSADIGLPPPTVFTVEPNVYTVIKSLFSEDRLRQTSESLYRKSPTSECIPCPPGSMSQAGATSIDECRCKEGFFRSAEFKWSDPCRAIGRPPTPLAPRVTVLSDTEILVEWASTPDTNGPISKPYQLSINGAILYEGYNDTLIQTALTKTVDSLSPSTQYCIAIVASTDFGSSMGPQQCATTRPAGCKRYLSLPGSYMLPTGGDAPCPPGTYSDKCGARNCTACLPGLHQPNTSATSVTACKACPSGFKSALGAGECERCDSDVVCPRTSSHSARIKMAWNTVPPKSPLVRLQDNDVVATMPNAQPVVLNSGMTSGGLAVLWGGIFVVLAVAIILFVAMMCPSEEGDTKNAGACARIAATLSYVDFVFTSILRDIEVTVPIDTDDNILCAQVSTAEKVTDMEKQAAAVSRRRCEVRKVPSRRRATITVLYFAGILAAAGYLVGEWMNSRYVETRTVVPLYNAAGDVISPPPGLKFRIVLLGSQLSCADAKVTVRALDSYESQATSQPVVYGTSCTSNLTALALSDSGEYDDYAESDLHGCGVGGASCFAITLTPAPSVRIYRSQSVALQVASNASLPVWAQAMRVWVSVPSWVDGTDSWVSFGAPSPANSRAAVHSPEAGGLNSILSGQVFTAPVALSHAYLAYGGDVRSRGFELYLSGEPLAATAAEPTSFIAVTVPVSVAATQTRIDVVEQHSITDLLARIFSFVGAIGTATGVVLAIVFKWPSMRAWIQRTCWAPLCRRSSSATASVISGCSSLCAWICCKMRRYGCCGRYRKGDMHVDEEEGDWRLTEVSSAEDCDERTPLGLHL